MGPFLIEISCTPSMVIAWLKTVTYTSYYLQLLARTVKYVGGEYKTVLRSCPVFFTCQSHLFLCISLMILVT